MPVPPNDRRPPLAVAMELSSTITSIALTMALPAAGGYYGDRFLGTSPWLLVLGAALGLFIGIRQLMAMTDRSRRDRGSSSRRESGAGSEHDGPAGGSSR